jgi:hypothetical protein
MTNLTRLGSECVASAEGGAIQCWHGLEQHDPQSSLGRNDNNADLLAKSETVTVSRQFSEA